MTPGRYARGTQLLLLLLLLLLSTVCLLLLFIGFNKISHENVSGKRAASGGAGLNVSGPAKESASMRKSRWANQENPDTQG